jgi:hypothetical protein
MRRERGLADQQLRRAESGTGMVLLRQQRLLPPIHSAKEIASHDPSARYVLNRLSTLTLSPTPALLLALF